MSDTPRDTPPDTTPSSPPSDDAVGRRPDPEVHGAPEPAEPAPTPLNPPPDDAVTAVDHEAAEPEAVPGAPAPAAPADESPVADHGPLPPAESSTAPETPPPAQEPTAPATPPPPTEDAASTPAEMPATPANSAAAAEEPQAPATAPTASGTPPRAVFDPAPPPPRDGAPPPPPEATAPGVGPQTPVAGPAHSEVSDPEVADDPAAADGSASTAPRRALARRWPLLLLPLVVVAVVVAAFAVKRNTDKVAEKVKTTPGLVTFTDEESGFTIKYPRSWKRATRPDPEIRFLASNGALDSLLVRVARTPAPFPPDLTGEEAKAVADVVLKRETFAPERILREQPVNVNGAPGYYYLYTFDEEIKTDSGTQTVQGVHAHYFVFQGRRVFALVFQALPTANFDRLATTFDAMAESFRIMPLASDAPDPTTTPPDSGPPPETAPPASPEAPPPPG